MKPDVLEPAFIKLAESYKDVEVVEPKDTGRAAWLAERRKGIGGSDAGAVCGVDPYRTQLDVYLDKIGEGKDRGENRHLQRGRKLEAIVADEYIARHPEDTLMAPQGVQIHPDHEWMLGNPDKIIASPRHTKDGHGILEIKVPSRHVYDKIRLNGVPAYYVLQMQHYLAVTGLKWGTFAIFNADKWELLLIDVERDDELIKALTKVEEKFWNEHVVPRKPPKDADKKEMRVELPKVEGRLRDMSGNATFGAALDVYKQAQLRAKEAEEYQEAAKKHLLGVLHEEPGVYENEDYRVYYTKVDGRKTFDKKALAGVRPLDRLKVAAELNEAIRDGDNFTMIATQIHSGELDLDLSEFEKQGNDFLTLRVFPAKRGDE